jgi:hypothetical protein
MTAFDDLNYNAKKDISPIEIGLGFWLFGRGVMTR